MTTLLVTGAGSLARATLLALAQWPGPIETIAIAARDTERLRWLARAVRARGAIAGRALDVRPYPIDWDEPGSLGAIVQQTRPRVVLHTATRQSAWTLGGADAWSALVRRIGYGVTLPLQLVLAARAGRALAAQAPDARLVNACFPDAVNPLLVRAGIPVACGIGNVAILAAMFRADQLTTPAPLRLVAHHAHVAAAITGREPPVPVRAWCGDRVIDDEVARWLATAHLPADASLNAVTGATAVPVLHALVDRSVAYRGHVPGPAGLCGGYPVTIAGGEIGLDVPPGVAIAELRALNAAAAAGDGLTIGADDAVGWSPRAATALDAAGPEIRDTLLGIFDDPDLEAGARRAAELRDRLANQPP